MLACAQCGAELPGAVAYGGKWALCADCAAADRERSRALWAKFGLGEPPDPVAVNCSGCGRELRLASRYVRCGTFGHAVEGGPFRLYYCSPRCEAVITELVRQGRNALRRVEHEPRACEHCGEPFTPARSDARYCSTAHRVAAYRERRRQEAASA